MNHITTAGGHQVRVAGGTGEASEAELAAIQLAELAESGRLTPELAAAHGCRGLIYALLALRETSAEHTCDIANALAGTETALESIADAVTAPDAVPDDAGADAGDALAVPEPTHVLSWVPDWEHRTPAGFWALQAAPGRRDVDVPDLPVPAELMTRDASPAELGGWLSAVLGYDVILTRGWRLTARIRPLRAWPQPEYTAYPVAPAACDGTSAGVVAAAEDGRYLLAPATADRPAAGPVLMAPPTLHCEGLDWHGAARLALTVHGVHAADLRQAGSGWRQDRCRRPPATTGKGHMWMLYTAGLAWGSPEYGARWVTPGELQDLADRTLGWAAAGDAGSGGGEALDPAWIGWLADLGIITASDAGRAYADRIAALPFVTPQALTA